MTQELLLWYKDNKRNLPFRNTKSAYKIWLSEVILHQTRVDQGLAYYYKFIEAYPKLADLARANEEEVLLLWQGLGYYSRARNLLFSARYIMSDLNGEFPKSFKELKTLKGVGDYTAAAIASIAFNEVVPVVDGNVYRVLSRMYCISEPIDTSNGKKLFFELATDLIDPEQPGEYNQALMELGALVCSPKTPLCLSCPVKNKCQSFARQSMLNYPVKSKKVKVKNRFFSFYIINDSESTYIKRRDNSDIWAGLYQFPLTEKAQKPSKEELIDLAELNKMGFKGSFNIDLISSEVKHVLSHQILFVRFIHLTSIGVVKYEGDECIIIDGSAVQNYAMPRVITKYLETV